MPKDYFRDITPPGANQNNKDTKGGDPATGGERSIRNIPIAHRRERGAHFPSPAQHDTLADMPPSAREAITPRARNRFMSPTKLAIWGAAVLALLGLGLIGFAMSQGTSVVVVPRTHTITLSEDIMLTAYPTTAEQAAQGALAYEIAERSLDAETTVSAHGFTEVEENASGIITVYNEHSEKPVRLIKNTRFETPSGLIFRTRDSIVVPGKKGASPGTLSVTVYADQPGEKYNIPPTDRFTVPGLKGGDMYANVYGRSAAAFTGGFIGSKPKVVDADLSAARSALRSQLEQQARNDAQGLAIDGKVAFPQLMTISFESLPFDVNAEGKAIVKERAVARVPVFPEPLFAKVLAAATRADAGDATVHLRALQGLQARRAPSDGVEQTLGTAPIDVFFSGSAELIWDVDTNALKQALLGTPKANFNATVGQFTSIKSADAFVRPFWRDTFPTDPAGIEVVVSDPSKK